MKRYNEPTMAHSQVKENGLFCVGKNLRRRFMMKYIEKNDEQLTMPLVVKEERRIPAKRVDIVSLKLVKESSMLYKNRSVSSPVHFKKSIRGDFSINFFRWTPFL